MGNDDGNLCEFKEFCEYEGKGDDCNESDYQLYCEQKEGFGQMEYDWTGREMIARKDCLKKGRENPEPKQFVDREKLVEAIEKRWNDENRVVPANQVRAVQNVKSVVLNIIRTHGQEEG